MEIPTSGLRDGKSERKGDGSSAVTAGEIRFGELVYVVMRLRGDAFTWQCRDAVMR